MLLGKSTQYKQIVALDPAEARLALSGLYLLMLLPIMMVFTRTGAEITAGLLSLIFLIRSSRLRQWRWVHRSPVLIALLIWFFSSVVVTPLALDPSLSFGRIYWFRFILLFAAIVYWLSAYTQEMRKIAAITLLLLVLCACDGIYQLITYFSIFGTPFNAERLTGPFTKTVLGIFLAKMSVPMLGMLFYFAWAERDRRKLAMLAGIAALMFGVILVSNERTAFLLFVLAMMLICTGLALRFRGARLPVAALLILAVVISMVSYHTRPTLQRRVTDTVQTLESLGTSTYAQLWEGAVIMLTEHPASGVGMSNFRIACPQLIHTQQVDFCAEHPHNIYLEFAAELGVPGFLGFIMLTTSFFVMVFQSYRRHRKERFILIIFAAAGLLVNFFPFAITQSFFSNWPAMLAWVSAAWSLALIRGRYENA